MMIPKPLRPGETVALVGPSGCIHEENAQELVQASAEKLRALGFA